MFKRNKKNNDEWYADYRMENGETGRVYSMEEVESVEDTAYNRGYKTMMWSVKGKEWFDSFKYPGE